jgi:hypothetical protein
MSFFETAKGNKRKGQPKGARLGYDATGTKTLLKTASHNLQLLLSRKYKTEKDEKVRFKLNKEAQDLLRAIIRKAKKLLEE